MSNNLTKQNFFQVIPSWLYVLLFYTASYLILFPHNIFRLSLGYLGGSRGDAAIYVWLAKANIDLGISILPEHFDAGIFYPFGYSMAYSDNYILPSIVGKIFSFFGANSELSYNLTLILAGVLNGFIAYLLTREIWGKGAAAVYAGFVFMLLPYYGFHRGHPQLQFAFFIPAVFLASIRFINRGTWLSATMIGFSVCGAFLSAVYYSIYAYILAAVILLAVFYAYGLRKNYRSYITLFIANLPWSIMLLCLVHPYREVRSAFGAVPPALIKQHSPTILAYLAAPWSNWLWPRFTHHLSHLEGYLFFGLLPLSLCSGAIGEICKNVQSAAFSKNVINKYLLFFGVYILGAALIFISIDASKQLLYIKAWSISFPFWLVLLFTYSNFSRSLNIEDAPALTCENYEKLTLFLLSFFLFASFGFIGSYATYPPLPELYKLLYYFPGVDALRGISRIALIPILAAIILSARGLDLILKKPPILYSIRRKYAIIVVIFGLTAVELQSRWDAIPRTLPAPPIYKTLESLPGDGAVLSLPIGGYAHDGITSMNRNSLYMRWIEPSMHPVVNGFSGKVPPYFYYESEELDNFPSARSLSKIGQLVGVKYVILNRQFMKTSKLTAAINEISEIPEQVEIIEKDKQGNYLLKVNPLVRIQDIESRSLYITSARKERQLAFEFRAPALTEKTKLQIYNGQELIYENELDVEAAKRWQHLSLLVKPSGRHVMPLEVKFIVANDSEVQLRNIELA